MIKRLPQIFNQRSSFSQFLSEPLVDIVFYDRFPHGINLPVDGDNRSGDDAVGLGFRSVGNENFHGYFALEILSDFLHDAMGLMAVFALHLGTFDDGDGNHFFSPEVDEALVVSGFFPLGKKTS